MSIFTLFLLVLAASQVYWAWRAWRVAGQLTASRSLRVLACATALAGYLALFAYNVGFFGRGGTPVRLTPGAALLSAPFQWWLVSSLAAFLVAMVLSVVRGLGRVRVRAVADSPESPDRRRFLEGAATVAVAVPFVAGAYGLLYGRLNLEVTPQPIRFARLPRVFEGFRIGQLSDIHIGPFMPEDEIRKYVAIANAERPDLMVLTGDFVTFDANTQYAVVHALSGLRAPFGVFACLGNHDEWAGVSDSITALFRQAGIRVLRQQNVSIASRGEAFNLIGVDFQSRRRFGPSAPVGRLLSNVERFIFPGQVNVLLSHNPDTFDRAAELGIDLSLAGHTHGGQVALEFLSPAIAPSRLITPYVAGWFQKPGSQLYVNRGIGTIGVPIRLGARPEITLYTLARG